MSTTAITKINQIYIRNFVFGVEDSLVSTVGLLSGVAVAGVESGTIILTGFVLICVEAFSMGVGSYLSEDTVDEAMRDKVSESKSLKGALVMFVSYLISGFVPLFPYLLSNSSRTIASSVVLTLIALLALGVLSAKLFNISLIKSSLRMLILGGSAIAIGVLVGRFVAI